MKKEPVMKNGPYREGDTAFKAAGGVERLQHLAGNFYQLMDSRPEFKTIRDLHHEDLRLAGEKLARNGSGERTHRLVFSPPRYRITCENGCWEHTAKRRKPHLRCRTCHGKIIYPPYTAPTA